jgi:autotransporter-associated beta strand protein
VRRIPHKTTTLWRAIFVLVLLLSVAASALVFSLKGSSTVLYWDANGTTDGFGTSLTGDWNTNAFWSTSSDGTATPILWPGTTNNDVIFSAVDCSSVSTVSVQNVLGPSAVSSVTIKAAAQTVKLSGQTSGRFLTMTNAASFNVENGTAAIDLDLAVNVAGSAGLNKTGAGALRMYQPSGYTGTTHVQQGTLLVGQNNVIPDNSAVVIDSGATLRFDGGGRQETVGSIAGAGSLILKSTVANAQALTSGGDNSSTVFSGLISSENATGWFVKTGTGTLTLSGDNTYSQETRVNVGTLLVNGDQSAATGTVTVAASAALGGGGTVGGDVCFENSANFLLNTNSTLTLIAGRTVTFAGFGVTNIIGLSSNTPPDTYTLIKGNVSFINVENAGFNNSYHLGGGTRAYFQEDGLQLVVASADIKIEKYSQAAFTDHVYQVVSNLESQLELAWTRQDYINEYINSPLFAETTNRLAVQIRRATPLSRGYHWNLEAISALYTATGGSNTDYAELIRDSLMFEAEVPSTDTQFSLGSMAYSYAQVKNDIGAEYRQTIESMLAQHANSGLTMESGTEMNRGILNTLGLLRVSKLLPDHTNCPAWTAAWNNNWTNGLLRIKDTNEDSINYNNLWLYSMMLVVDELGIDQETFYNQPWVEEIFERHLNVRTPLGVEPEVNYGTLSYGDGSSACWEWAGKIYQDGRYRWAAQRIINFYRAQPACTNRMPRFPLFLYTDDSITPVEPSGGSYYSHRRYDREFPNKLVLRNGYGSNATFLALNLFNLGGHGIADGSAIYCLMDQYGLLLSGGHRYSPGEEYSNLLLVRNAGDPFPFGSHYKPGRWIRGHVNLRAGNTATGGLNINLEEITLIGLRVEANSTPSAQITLGLTSAQSVGGSIGLFSNEVSFAGSSKWPAIPLNPPKVNLSSYDELDIWWKYDAGVRLKDVQIILNSSSPTASSRWSTMIDNWRTSRVRYFGDAQKVHFASVDVSLYAYDGNNHRQYRDIILLPNRLVWVRDTMIWGGSADYQAGPLWHIHHLNGQGEHWFQTSTHAVYDEEDSWTAAGEPRSLLIVLPPRTAMRAECVSSTCVPGGRPYTVFQKWEGAVTNGVQTAFNSLLIPNTSTNPAALAAQAQLLFENDRAAVLQYDNWLLVDNPDGLTVAVGDVETNYKLLAVELDNSGNAVYAAGMEGTQCLFKGQNLSVEGAL